MSVAESFMLYRLRDKLLAVIPILERDVSDEFDESHDDDPTSVLAWRATEEHIHKLLDALDFEACCFVDRPGGLGRVLREFRKIERWIWYAAAPGSPATKHLQQIEQLLQSLSERASDASEVRP